MLRPGGGGCGLTNRIFALERRVRVRGAVGISGEGLKVLVFHQRLQVCGQTFSAFPPPTNINSLK